MSSDKDRTLIDAVDRFGLREVAYGGGPPHDGDMEQRVEQLESDMGQVKQSLARIEGRLDEKLPNLATKADVSDLRADIRHLPGKTFVITTVISIVGLVIAAIALAPYLRVPIGQ